MTDVLPPGPHRSGYEHLMPLFAELHRVAPGDARHARLRARIIEGYRPVALHIARKYGNRGEPADDLEQVATVGLILAVDRFDLDRHLDFLTFAVPTVTGEVLRYFRDRSALIRVPRRVRGLQGEIYDAVAELAQRHGRAPRPSEIAAALGVDVDVVLEGLAAYSVARTASLDEPARSGDGGAGNHPRFGAALGHDEPAFDLVEQRETLGPLLGALPQRERSIVLLRFFGGLTQTEIGERVGISQMHVSRLLARTLSTLRRQLADR